MHDLFRLDPYDDWRDGAVCRQTGGDVFFPGQGDSLADARALCRQCPVQPQCLAEALRNAEPHGVWGGVSAQGRKRMLREAAT